MENRIIRYFNGDLSSGEKKTLFEELSKNDSLKKEFLDIQNLRGLDSLIPGEQDSSFARKPWHRFKKEQRKKKIIRYAFSSLKYAAIILLTITISHFFFDEETKGPEDDDFELTYEEFIAPAGQRAMLRLQDGSVIWLNARSTLRYPVVFAKSERRVELDGEAFFDIKHHEDHPFVVSTEKLDIKVHGTQFNVFAYKGYNEFRTALTEGSVSIHNSGKAESILMLDPYECAELKNNTLYKSSFSNLDFLMWREGIYAFDDLSFNEIKQKLELYYDVTILVENQYLGNYKFTGKFRQRDGVESVLRTLMKVYKFSYVKDEDRNIITIR